MLRLLFENLAQWIPLIHLPGFVKGTTRYWVCVCVGVCGCVWVLYMGNSGPLGEASKKSNCEPRSGNQNITSSNATQEEHQIGTHGWMSVLTQTGQARLQQNHPKPGQKVRDLGLSNHCRLVLPKPWAQQKSLHIGLQFDRPKSTVDCQHSCVGSCHVSFLWAPTKMDFGFPSPQRPGTLQKDGFPFGFPLTRPATNAPKSP